MTHHTEKDVLEYQRATSTYYLDVYGNLRFRIFRGDLFVEFPADESSDLRKFEAWLKLTKSESRPYNMEKRT